MNGIIYKNSDGWDVLKDVDEKKRLPTVRDFAQRSSHCTRGIADS